MRKTLALSLAALPLLLAGCGEAGSPDAPAGGTRSATLVAVDPPAAPGAMAPRLGVGGDGPLLTWIEPSGDGHRLRLSRLDPGSGTWSDPVTVMEGATAFANWADLPMAAEGGDGTLAAHWLEKLGESTYAYGATMAVSRDGGATWERAGLLHDDESPNEHGFVSWVPTDEGLQAFWLDGREMGGGGHDGHGEGEGEPAGPMQIRTAAVVGGVPAASLALDDRTCECCAADAAMAAAGPVVVYRNRTEDEVRDVAIVRRTAEGWSEPAIVHEDGWTIPGCPVNGPAVVADGERVTVAWFTGADAQGRVQVAVSEDGGATFAPPLLVDDAKPLGRVDLVLGPDGTPWVSWLASTGETAELRIAAVRDGALDGPWTVTPTTASRSAGVPQLGRVGDDLLAVWVDTGESSHVRAALVRP